MTEKARVVVVRDGFTRMFEMNGAGLVELVTVRGELRTEDAAGLHLRISEFLEHALPQSHTTPRSVSNETLALPAGAIEHEGEVRPMNVRERAQHNVEILVEYLRGHAGQTRGDIADGLGWTLDEAQRAIINAKKAHRIQPKGRYWYVPKATRGAAGPNKRGAIAVNGPGWQETYEWIQAHPGSQRPDIQIALGFAKRQDVNNRLGMLRLKGLVTEDENRAIWPVLGPGSSGSADTA